MRAVWFGAAAALVLAGCGQSGGGKASDPYAGLDAAIQEWRAHLVSNEAACKAKAPDGADGCQQFEVACKVEDPVTEADRAAGVSRKVLAAMTWTAADPQFGGSRPASATAVFSRTPEGWTRVADKPVNLRTCARV